MSVTSVSITKQTDIAIVGAGPHALTLVTHLLKKRSSASRFLVFEKSGTWLHQWQHQFAALEIPHLRSPVNTSRLSFAVDITVIKQVQELTF